MILQARFYHKGWVLHAIQSVRYLLTVHCQRPIYHCGPWFFRIKTFASTFEKSHASESDVVDSSAPSGVSSSSAGELDQSPPVDASLATGLSDATGVDGAGKILIRDVVIIDPKNRLNVSNPELSRLHCMTHFHKDPMRNLSAMQKSKEAVPNISGPQWFFWD